NRDEHAERLQGRADVGVDPVFDLVQQGGDIVPGGGGIDRALELTVDRSKSGHSRGDVFLHVPRVHQCALGADVSILLPGHRSPPWACEGPSPWLRLTACEHARYERAAEPPRGITKSPDTFFDLTTTSSAPCSDVDM